MFMGRIIYNSDRFIVKAWSFDPCGMPERFAALLNLQCNADVPHHFALQGLEYKKQSGEPLRGRVGCCLHGEGPALFAEISPCRSVPL